MAKEAIRLPLIFQPALPEPMLLAQGAEALLYKTHFLERPAVLKFRPPKTWRHPILDARLTRHRVLAEARILVRCRRAGVPVPAVQGLDWEGRKNADGSSEGGWMLMEWIDGGTVRNALNAWIQSATEDIGPESKWQVAIVDLMRRIGETIGKLHAIGVTHGDLTTSNLMLRYKQSAEDTAEAFVRPGLDGEVILIDFGLASTSVQGEDRAVDLYVLERAFGSTHPSIEDHFQEVLRAYGESYKGAKQVLKKLEDVRQRGRKKSMIG